MFKTATTERFGGLRLDVDAGEIGLARAAERLNTDLSTDGSIRPRPGLEIHATAPSGTSLAFLYALPNSNMLLAVDTSGDTVTYDNAGTSVDTDAGTATVEGAYSAVDTDDGTYVANGSGARFIDNAGTITAPAFTGHTPIGECLALTPLDNRLVVNDGADRVRFSDPGNPLVFDTDNWIDLGIDDTERIRAIVTWRDLVFIFKRTKAWVYTSTSTGSDGGPVFNTRPIANVPALDYAGMPVAVGRDGVYYLSRSGIYVTTGDTPRKVSGAIDPIFATIPDQVTTGTANKQGSGAMTPALHWAQDRLYVAYSTGAGSTPGNDRMLVWDQRTDEWTMWTLKHGGSDPGVTAICSQPINSSTSTAKQLLVANARHDPGGIVPPYLSLVRSLTNISTCEDEFDSGGTLTPDWSWSYESGYGDLGSPLEKKVRFTDVYGTGTVDVQLLARGVRPADVPDPGGSVALGVSDVERARRPRGVRGRMFAHRISGTGPAVVTRIDHHYHPPRRAA